LGKHDEDKLNETKEEKSTENPHRPLVVLSIN
jgi:hypothetical protein